MPFTPPDFFNRLSKSNLPSKRVVFNNHLIIKIIVFRVNADYHKKRWRGNVNETQKQKQPYIAKVSHRPFLVNDKKQTKNKDVKNRLLHKHQKRMPTRREKSSSEPIKWCISDL